MSEQAIATESREEGEVSLGAAGSAKLRNPVHVLIFDLLTLGVYGVVWYYKVNAELAMLGRARGTTELGEKPIKSLLALFPGLVLIVPTVISMLHTVERLQAAQRLEAVSEAEYPNPPLAFVLMFFLPPVGGWYFQKRLNGVWHAEQSGSATEKVSL